MEIIELWKIFVHLVLKMVSGSHSALGKEYRFPEAKKNKQQQQLFNVERVFDYLMNFFVFHFERSIQM